MLRTWLRERRGVTVGASVAVVCLSAGAVAGFGGSGGPAAYVAVGAAGGSPGEPGSSVAPTGKVQLVPLDSDPGSDAGSTPGKGKSGGKSSGKGAGKGASTGSGAGSAEPGASGSAGSPSGSSSGSPSASSSPGGGHVSRPSGSAGAGGSSGAGGSGNSGAPSGGSTSGGPASLTVSEPAYKDTDKRWCQDVTLVLRNSGGSAVRSGTVTFGTHIIGGLGIDWATIESTEKLPAPIEAGAEKKKTWTVCVESWRVPLGMHIETRDISVEWK
ncbi:hypothetical protein AB0J38_01340 [Streptomyces sp. NPDC050095]|uniref:hypothetical protein n=1 Tax=unclassified Streptomyces TaxID=2593676 RepID=UPI00343213BD